MNAGKGLRQCDEIFRVGEAEGIDSVSNRLDVTNVGALRQQAVRRT